MRSLLTTSAAFLVACVMVGCGGGSSSGGGPALPVNDPTGLNRTGTNVFEQNDPVITIDATTMLGETVAGNTITSIAWDVDGDGSTDFTTTSGSPSFGLQFTTTTPTTAIATITYSDGTTATITYTVAVSPAGAPVITIDSFTLKGTATDASGIASVDVVGPNGTVSDVSGSTNWQTQFNLDGLGNASSLASDPGAGTLITYTFSVTATDTAATPNTSSAKTVTIDLQ